MTSQSAPQHEPTMEEILASIRKIISEDSADQPVKTPETSETSDEADVLELTQEMAAEPETAGTPQNASIEGDVVFEEIEEPIMDNEVPSDEGIFSDKTRSALDNALASLAEQPAPEPAYAMPQGDSVQAVFERAIRSGFESLLREHLNANTETLIEHMKPLIREWMDDNFPPLLESAVRAEVARAVKARGRR